MNYTEEQWSKDGTLKVQPGQQIETKIYDALLNVLPPRRLPHADFPVAVTSGFMCGEPYTHEEFDGVWQAFYFAFGRNGDKCYYLGLYSASGNKLPNC